MDSGVLTLADIPPEAHDCIYAYEKAPTGNSYMDALLTILGGVLQAARRMEEQNIPERIIRATFADIGLWVRRCKRQQGHWGLAGPAAGWLQNHLECKIFRVGRFQCIPRYLSPDWNVRFYRHKATRRVLAITAGDVAFRGDGQISGTNGVFAGTDGFRGFFRERQEKGKTVAEGLVISPAGYGENKTAVLDQDEWALILRTGMPVFELHIPVDGDFQIETCRKTLADMRDFSVNHGDALTRLTGIEGPFVAFTLGSWLLNAQLDGILSRSSNLVRHLRQYYLLPVLCGEDNELFWIFDGRKIDIDNPQPEDQQTSLQRRIIQYIREGGKVRYNLGVIMFDDVGDFGNEIYRKK